MNQETSYPSLLLSVISHGHAGLVSSLMYDLEKYCKHLNLTVVLTQNIEESFDFEDSDFSFTLKRIKNSVPAGFGANHNRVFNHYACDYFCIVNPDIRLVMDPISPLLEMLRDPAIGIVAPLVIAPDGSVQDSARHKITPASILGRIWSRQHGPDYAIRETALDVDWAAGMFLLVRASDFREIGGFDERYFLYCEDADLCERMRFLGRGVRWVPQARVCHEARRASHRSLRHTLWHMSSLFRFLRIHWLQLRGRGWISFSA